MPGQCQLWNPFLLDWGILSSESAKFLPAPKNAAHLMCTFPQGLLVRSDGPVQQTRCSTAKLTWPWDSPVVPLHAAPGSLFQLPHKLWHFPAWCGEYVHPHHTESPGPQTFLFACKNQQDTGFQKVLHNVVLSFEEPFRKSLLSQIEVSEPEKVTLRMKTH